MSACNNFCFTILAKDLANNPSFPSAALTLAECLGLGQLSWLQSGGLRRSQGGRKGRRSELEGIRSESAAWPGPCAAGVIPDDGGG